VMSMPPMLNALVSLLMDVEFASDALERLRCSASAPYNIPAGDCASRQLLSHSFIK
jgi:hypothetical protein